MSSAFLSKNNRYEDPNGVSYSAQSPTAAQAAQARENIGAASNPNLLDNWYFVGAQISNSLQTGGFPINQREQSSYNAAGYGIDRWMNAARSGFLLTPTPTGLCVSGFGDVYQTVKETVNYESVGGRTVTISALFSDGTILTGSAEVPTVQPLTTTFLKYVQGLYLQAIGSDSNIKGCLYVGFSTGDTAFTANKTIIAIKLELGDKQTLARQENGAWVLNDPPPDYGQELAKCQRYLQVVDVVGPCLPDMGGLYAAIRYNQTIRTSNAGITAVPNATIVVVNMTTVYTLTPTSVNADLVSGARSHNGIAWLHINGSWNVTPPNATLGSYIVRSPSALYANAEL